MKKFLVGSGLAVGLFVGLAVGLSPGRGGISLTSRWTLRPILAGVSGSGNPDGADGIAFGDFDDDGKLDAVTGHEQGLRRTLSFNPGVTDGAVLEPWPTVTLPTVNGCSVEDAIACDVDQDGNLDIVNVCETGSQRVELDISPGGTRTNMLTAANWTRVTLDASAGLRSMRVACVDLTGDAAPELLVGGKDAGVAASLGWYESATPTVGSSWTYTSIVPVGWVMDMEVMDFDGDGKIDIVYSDKEGINAPSPDDTHRGIHVLYGDGADPPDFSDDDLVTANEGQWKWFSVVDWDGDADYDIAACRSEAPSLHEQTIWLNQGGGSWTELPIPIPANSGLCQETVAFDLDKDGKLDIITSYSNAAGKSAATWSRQTGTPLDPAFVRGEISGVLDADTDVKMDNIGLIDLDLDDDTDIVLTEQHDDPDPLAVDLGTGPGRGVIGLYNPLTSATFPIAPPAVNCSVLASGTLGAGTTAVTSSVSPGANRLIIPVFMSALAGGPAVPTSATGNGITYAQVATQAFHTGNARRVTAFRGMSASPSAGAITLSMGAVSQTSYIYSIIECDGVDTGGTNGSSAVVQSAINTATAATSVTSTLSALAAATSVNVACSGISINGAQTPDADFVELSDNNTGTGTSGMECQWATNQTTATPTFSSANAGIVSLEVKIAP